MEKKEYRSALRSRKLIRQAFVELLQEKPLEKITVTDIVARADINRSTFYAHYPDVRGLVEALEKEALDNVSQLLPRLKDKSFFEDPLPFLRSIETLIGENQELYRLLGQSDHTLRALERVKEDFIRQTMQSPDLPAELRDSLQFRLRLIMYVGGTMQIYIQWLKGELDHTLEQLTKQIADMITDDAGNILR